MATNSEDGLVYFVKPLDVDEPFSAFLRYVREQEKRMHGATNVKYAQTRRSQNFTINHLHLIGFRE